jgi:hypothetical protein
MITQNSNLPRGGLTFENNNRMPPILPPAQKPAGLTTESDTGTGVFQDVSNFVQANFEIIALLGLLYFMVLKK